MKTIILEDTHVSFVRVVSCKQVDFNHDDGIGRR